MSDRDLRVAATERLRTMKAAANGGDLEAQLSLGAAYNDCEGNAELGVKKRNLKEAVKWFSKAAEQGDPHAQVFMARSCDTGEGVIRNIAQAADWYRKVG